MTTTKVWRAAEGGDAAALAGQLEEAAGLLRDGELIAFPTETVYGLGADARNTKAVEGIFRAKGRPSDNPLIVHIADERQLAELVLPYPELAARLMKELWPGPLTIVLPVRPDAVSPLVTAGLSTVGVRMPDHPAALALIRQSGCPVAAPSANRSGRPSPTLAEHVLEDLGGKISGIVDGGATGVGLESTVIELPDSAAIRILRPGGITAEQLQSAAPEAVIDAPAAKSEVTEAPRSPGMKYTHYAPQGDLEIVQGNTSKMVLYIREQVHAAKAAHLKTGVLAFDERRAAYDGDLVLTLGSELNLEQAAHSLYAALRRFDAEGVQRIWAEGCSEEGIGHALMNRLAKAAGHQIIRV
ncbi:L-threonylcarbamoyladenylate synthase [Paenibacillus glycanilyticus]|uniref:L-threonylcarbamoyladenylate synthase n=1 Tax=Paenibacillus glycanilyticus TaxID=126569 RepID=UPI002041F3DA|nr:L-threonylcarbamoyladenylate synthase [Paenibacillus glycanilyticus]MCM3628032.1 L-threonylcarbamoyladenylate synthase [Paenibacillus glycanilyticus]